MLNLNNNVKLPCFFEGGRGSEGGLREENGRTIIKFVLMLSSKEKLNSLKGR